MQHYISDHVKMVGKCESALTELFAGKQPQVVILSGTTISSALVRCFGPEEEVRPVFLPMESHRSGKGDDSSKVFFGRLGGMRTVIVQGRVHANEEENPLSPVVIPRAMATAAKDAIFIVLNTAMSIDSKVCSPGRLAITSDHITSFSGNNPLAGEPSIIERFGSRFVVSNYDAELRQVATKVFTSTSGLLTGLYSDAIYLMAPGPQLPTQAELRLYRSAGANLVGTPLPEVLALNQMGKRVLGLSLLIDSVVTDNQVQLMRHDERVSAIEEWVQPLAGYLIALVAELPVVTEAKPAATSIAG